MKRICAVAGIALAGAVLAGCGGSSDAAEPVVQVRATESASPVVAASASVAPVLDVRAKAIGTDQALYVNGVNAGRVQVMSFDMADATATVQINNVAPVTIDPADFVLIQTDGSEIHGAAAVAAWDRVLGPNDQTTGPVRFAGATSPAQLVYVPSGAEPLAWSF